MADLMQHGQGSMSPGSGSKPQLTESTMDKFDIDGDGELSIIEARAGMYKHLESHIAESVRTSTKVGIVVKNHYLGHRRYNKIQEKALRLLEHSKDVFGYDTVVAEDRSLLLGIQQSTMFAKKSKWKKPRGVFNLRPGTGKTVFGEANKAMRKAAEMASEPSTVWTDAIEGNVNAIQRHVVLSGFDVRTHHEADGGSTVLHYAAWYSHLPLVMWLISHVRETYGPEQLIAFMNAPDTVYHRSTPLIEAVRNNIGHLANRLEVVQELVDAGAQVNYQDASGDNCLHWAVRRQSLPMVRYIVNNTSEAVIASVTDNHSSMKPIDIAADAIGAQGQAGSGAKLGFQKFVPAEIFRVLQKLKKGCNMRLKIQGLHQKRIDDELYRATSSTDQVEALRDVLADFMQTTESTWDRHIEKAEKERQRSLKVVFQDAKVEGILRGKNYIRSDAGKADLIQRAQQIKAEQKRSRKKGKKSSKKQAEELILEEKRQEVLGMVEERFGRKRPPCKQFAQVELEKALLVSKRLTNSSNKKDSYYTFHF